ncbi:MAG: hypothetical protein JKY45_07015 [Emcibacter sp.]|nr:hypothetical protein [Emcibacter sp.]
MIKKTAIFVTLSLSVANVGGLAQAGQMQPILDCIKITENAERLRCYDKASQKIINAGMQGSNIVISKPTKADQVADFGRAQLRTSPVKAIREQEKKEDKSLDTIRLSVTKYTYTASGKVVFFMKNGQAWKQKDGGKIHLPKGGFDVRIKKGVIGGYNLFVPNKKSFIRVKRLR